MKRLTLKCLLALLVPLTTQANVLNFEYEYDGTNFYEINSSAMIDNAAMFVGDTVDITVRAKGNDYWDVSLAGNLFSNNLALNECGTRGSSGNFSASMDGSQVVNQNFSIPSQSCIHLGPNNIDFTGVTAIDLLHLVVVMTASTTATNTLLNPEFTPSWSIFGLDVNAPVTYVDLPDVSAPEPAILALLALGLVGLGSSRRKS